MPKNENHFLTNHWPSLIFQYKIGKKTGYPSCVESGASLEMATAVFLTDAFTEAIPLDDKNQVREVSQTAFCSYI